MKGDILYLLALWLLGYAVNKMVEDAEAKAQLDLDSVSQRTAYEAGYQLAYNTYKHTDDVLREP